MINSQSVASIIDGFSLSGAASKSLSSHLIFDGSKVKLHQFLFVVKATALQQQISEFYRHIISTEASYIYTSQWPVKCNS